MADVGIDLGTTNSAISHLRNRPEIIENDMGNQTTPSVVAWDDEIIVGDEAKNQAAALEDVVISVKRDMGTQKKSKLGENEMLPEEVSAEILKYLKQSAEERLGEPVDSAVITIPAYFSGAQKEATKKAGELAGLKSVRLLAEPIAAALAYGAEDIILVYDLGGGTFDVAIIDCYDYKMIGLDGDNYLGGDDFDSQLISHLAKEIKSETGVDIESDKDAMATAKQECERAKKDLSKRKKTKIRFQEMVGDKSVNVTVEVTREQYNEMIGDLVQRTLEKVENAIELAKKKDPDFTKESIETVLLVGGSTYTPLVQEKLAEFFGKEPSKQVNPDLAVALGAGVHTASGGTPKGVHRIRIDPLPEVTAEGELKIKGRTSPGAKIEIQGAASPVHGEVKETGKFSISLELLPDKVNEITVVSTDSNGEERKSGFEIRQDSTFTGEEQKGRRKASNVGGGLLPRTLGIRLGKQKDLLGVITPEHTELPCRVVSNDYGVSGAPNTPGILMLEIYEGDLPDATLNTHLASLRLDTPATPTESEPMEITFQINDEHLLTVTARMVNYPDRMVTAEINCKSPSGEGLHVIEHADRVLNVYSEKLRPEQKAKINKLKQGLMDLCERFKGKNETDEQYPRIQKMGADLRAELISIESRLG